MTSFEKQKQNDIKDLNILKKKIEDEQKILENEKQKI